MFRGWYRVFGVVLSYNKAVWVLSFSAIVQGIISVILNVILIPEYGMYGAAISVCLSVALYFFIVAFWAQRVDPILINVKLLTGFLVFSTVITVSINIINDYFSVGIDLFLIKLGVFLFSIFSLSMLSGNGRKIVSFLRFKNES